MVATTLLQLKLHTKTSHGCRTCVFVQLETTTNISSTLFVDVIDLRRSGRETFITTSTHTRSAYKFRSPWILLLLLCRRYHFSLPLLPSGWKKLSSLNPVNRSRVALTRNYWQVVSVMLAHVANTLGIVVFSASIRLLGIWLVARMKEKIIQPT